jgi:sugar phosphate isomerase/epimerase
MDWSRIASRLGLNVPYEWWPSAATLKEIEAAGFASAQVPSPPASVLSDPRLLTLHATALAEARATCELELLVHGPGSLRAGTRHGDRAFEGLLAYASGIGAGLVVYHAANLPDEPASEDALLAEIRSLSRLGRRAESLGVSIAIENLAPVFPGPDALCFSPRLLRSVANRVDSPAVGLCLDVGHANVVAGLRHTDPAELVEPALDHAIAFHLHDNLGARRGISSPPELDPLRLDLHLPPGRGTAPWGRLGPLLRRAAGPLVLEVHPPHRPAPAALREESLRALGTVSEPRRTAGRAG